MDLVPTDEQQEIAAAAAGFLDTELPVRRLMELEAPEPCSADLWRQLGELGWFGLGIAEELGGVGLGPPEEALLCRELGRVLAPPSVLATVLAAHCSAETRASDLLADLLDGAARVAFARPSAAGARVGQTLSGSFQLYDAGDADYLLVPSEAGVALLDASRAADARARPCIDQTVELSSLDLDAADALAFVPLDAAPLARRSTLLVAAQLVGAAEATRDLAAAYARERQQFGQPIGAFQAVKHACADTAMRCDAALSQLLFAVVAFADDRADAAFHVAAAQTVAAQAAERNAAACLQVHGGYGFTVEYAPQYYVKRCRVLEQIGGPRRSQMAEVLACAAPL